MIIGSSAMAMPPRAAPSLQAVATGRMGRIATRVVVDDAVGTMLGAVECIDVASHELALALHDALDRSWAGEIDHVNVFQYDSTRIVHPCEGTADSWTVELLANKAIAKHLRSVVSEFGRLHAMVTRQYVRAVVQGLEELHRHGFSCGGLSLSNLFLCEGRVQIGAWFPPSTVLRQVNETHATMFADNPFAQSTLRRHDNATLLELQQRDLQSLAFLLVEMLTGKRVMLNRLANSTNELLEPFAVDSMERAFLQEVLQPSVSLIKLASNPYLLDDNTTHPPGSVSLSQRELVLHLIDKELSNCRAVQKSEAHHVRVWIVQFEKKFHRKPHADERPASIQRLQQRCRALQERIQELERRGNTPGHAACSARQLIPASCEAVSSDMESLPVSKIPVSTLGIDTTTTISSGLEPGDLVDRRRRSPAQNAFLRQLSTSGHSSPASDTQSETGAASRERGHELLHQRKEVMDVILGLEK